MAKTIVIVILAAIIAGGLVYILKPVEQVHMSVTVEQIKAIAKLGTVEYTVSAMEEKQFTSSAGLTRFRSDYVTVIGRGKVIGSVNLDKVSVDVMESTDDRHVKIHFGPGSVEVSDPQIGTDPDAMRTISCQEKLGAQRILGQPATSDQKDLMEADVRAAIKREAINTGILKSTMENAKTALGGFVGSFGYRADITFDENAYDPNAS